MDLKQLIRASGLRQRHVAQQMGLTEAMLSQTVTGRRKLTGVNIADLARLLGKSADEVIAASEKTMEGRDALPIEPAINFDTPFRRQTMTHMQRITVDPDQCGGRPCLRGLRIRVRDVLDLLAAGASRDEILADYPLLEPEDITASLEYAARQTDHPVLRVA